MTSTRSSTRPTEINVHEAKTHLSRLLSRVEKGEEIIIARAGRPVARLVAWQRPAQPRVLGQDAGRVRIADDFDEPLPATVLAEFER